MIEKNDRYFIVCKGLTVKNKPFFYVEEIIVLSASDFRLIAISLNWGLAFKEKTKAIKKAKQNAKKFNAMYTEEYNYYKVNR